MPQRIRTAEPPKTIAWFEQEIVQLTPKQGLLDATSLGIWTINEQAGITAGEWKRHRILMQDLDMERIGTALGEILGAIVQTAHAIDIPLETLMTQQVERMRTIPLKGNRHRKNTQPPPPPARDVLPPKRETAVASAPLSLADQPRRSPGRRKAQSSVEQKPSTTAKAQTPSVEVVVPAKRGRPAKKDQPPEKQPVETTPAKGRAAKATTMTAIQPVLFDLETKKRRSAKRANLD